MAALPRPPFSRLAQRRGAAAVAARVGNDVVDLGHPATAQAHLRQRFVRRVLCQNERARLARVGESGSLLWTLFAAKEAAYKAVVKLRPGTIFAHRRFVVAEDLQSVRHGDLTLTLRVQRDRDLVHAIAIAGDAESPVWSGADKVVAGADLSREVRRLLCDCLGPCLGCKPSELQVSRPPVPGSWDGYGPPVVCWGGARVAVDVSLSHDGRFVGFAAIPSPDPFRGNARLPASGGGPGPGVGPTAPGPRHRG